MTQAQPTDPLVLLAIVLLRYTDSDYPFGIFKLFLLTICLLDELVSLTISVMINRIYFFTVTVASIIKFQPG